MIITAKRDALASLFMFWHNRASGLMEIANFGKRFAIFVRLDNHAAKQKFHVFPTHRDCHNDCGNSVGFCTIKTRRKTSAEAGQHKYNQTSQ